MQLVNSHCHLNYPGVAERHDDVLKNAQDAGVTAMLNISTRQSEWDDVIGIAHDHSHIWASIGIHPHEADSHQHIDRHILIERANADDRIVAIGETGLDYYYEHSDRDAQKYSFREHIVASRETGLPLIIHTRDAEDDTAQIIAEEMEQGAFPALIHCFTASAEFATKMLDLGLYISISGIVTFKNARDLQAVAKDLPLEKMLVETDAPFLAPVPHRGKKGEPAFVADTARFLSELRGEDYETLCQATSNNFYRLFSKAQNNTSERAAS